MNPDPQSLVQMPLAPPSELARRYERARRDATNVLESLVFDRPEHPRVEEVVDAFELVALWRLAVGGDLRPTHGTWALMVEATNP